MDRSVFNIARETEHNLFNPPNLPKTSLISRKTQHYVSVLKMTSKRGGVSTSQNEPHNP